jgi:polysaccharide pyruvyl transferase WcaK-like protein
MKKIGIIGYYNQKNFGDDLLGYLFFKKVSEIYKGGVIILDASLELRETLELKSNHTVKENISECSHVVCGGGGVLGELNKRRFGWKIFLPYFKIIRILKKKNIKYSFFCVGAGPIRSIISKLIVRYFVSGADTTVVRDKESVKILKKIVAKGNIIEGVDYALSLNKNIIPETSRNKAQKLLSDAKGSVLGVNLFDFNCHDAARTQNSEELILQGIKKAHTDNRFETLVIFVSMLNGPESIGALKLMQLFPKAKLYVHNNTLDTLAVIEQLDFLFTQKLHVSIAAYALSVPSFCIGYHPKIKRFYDYVGASENYMNVTDLEDNISPFIELFFSTVKENRFIKKRADVIADIKLKTELAETKMANFLND